ncbi:MAG: hypothetical protein UU71_C0040G0004 [Parcubacteria group bacterium GW2011_GWB1_41_6]|uniref:Carotenoid biosynthesis protein n=1 Tax=Candidatus Daviesbacteria bacterium GW2011_GWC2_40_12 TaxID=1618431 RepID=A0A0G0QJU5_9BACT|nr:MAG: hypothetical protein UT77_C0020G0006 [Candidatus Daviesbacteria bacterium GW2011_GWC2_40_12]KKS13890.1 MAG: hypothetical protein UU71_C0040G0004 [Parcubacteria group bacterium GW2011_GWB1_41_6]KKS56891.1 MAG: hypothetical protein UV22_C0024G0006 [Parcubacteria group bacterium GW2011_GWA2_42_35]KKS70418.1 MAG: hypothetical protein UV43_C0064G0004 [Parcubacteria group bacterium GW2011_GWF2_42_7]
MFFFLFEFLSIAFFLLLLGRELIKKRGHVYTLAAGAIFGFLLELFSTHVSHTYTYGDFYFALKGVPIFIALDWAIIFYLALSFSDQFELPWSVKPFLDALIAINLDLAIDAIAIRAGFWTWVIPLNQEWYGVPFENLAGWILATLTFSFLIRFIRKFNPRRLLVKLAKLALPFLASIIYPVLSVIYISLALIPFHIDRLFKWSELWRLYKKFSYAGLSFQPEVALWKLIILTFMLAQLVNISFYFLIRHGRTKHFDFVSFSFFTLFHLIFLFGYFITGMFWQAPFLLFIALTMLGLHFFLHLILPLGLINLSWFRKIKSLVSN